MRRPSPNAAPPAATSRKRRAGPQGPQLSAHPAPAKHRKRQAVPLQGRAQAPPTVAVNIAPQKKSPLSFFMDEFAPAYVAAQRPAKVSMATVHRAGSLAWSKLTHDSKFPFLERSQQRRKLIDDMAAAAHAASIIVPVQVESPQSVSVMALSKLQNIATIRPGYPTVPKSVRDQRFTVLSDPAAWSDDAIWATPIVCEAARLALEFIKNANKWALPMATDMWWETVIKPYGYAFKIYPTTSLAYLEKIKVVRAFLKRGFATNKNIFIRLNDVQPPQRAIRGAPKPAAALRVGDVGPDIDQALVGTGTVRVSTAGLGPAAADRELYTIDEDIQK